MEIVGAGLAGLVAGINLAREGFEVVIYEKEKNCGGRPNFRPDPAGTPINLDKLKDFIGVDISPACRRINEYTFYVYGGKGKVLRTPKTAYDGYMVERSGRESSLDYLLTQEALDVGVKIEYGREIRGWEDLSKLPPNSIITTGLEANAYSSLGLPLINLFGIYARGRCDMVEPTTAGYFDSYTKFYGFTSSINKVCFSFLIGQAGKTTQSGVERFKQQVADTAPFELGPWQTMEWAGVPTATMFRPRLFLEDKILAGTLAGIMDPTLLFGMLGALVSGKIAATAVSDRKKARRQFKQITRTYSRSWLIKRAHDLLPDIIRRPLTDFALSSLENRSDKFWQRVWSVVPGYNVFG
ncbi:MAG: NAD(P)-binding protein [Deltaproteobacteria bacterium]|nr:NAD(P)-binding protein [Deltaproteobacteria bacterium]